MHAAEVMKAYADGKEIEYKKREEGYWTKCDYPIFDWVKYDYRVKQQPSYRPFRDGEECWKEMLNHYPFGWIRTNKNGYFCIDIVSSHEIIFMASSCKFDEYLVAGLTFADGTPFGMPEEEPEKAEGEGKE